MGEHVETKAPQKDSNGNGIGDACETAPPPVPPDAFDNIGHRTAGWVVGLPANETIGNIYVKYADYFTDTPLTINEIFKQINDEMRSVDGIDKYETFGTNIAADLTSRWPMSKGTLRDHFLAIALGLGVK